MSRPDFEAETSIAGYRVDRDAAGAPVRIEPTDPGRGVKRSLITEGAAFLRFAELPTPLTDKEWLRFVRRFGLLGIPEGPEYETASRGELAKDWELEISSLRAAGRRSEHHGTRRARAAVVDSSPPRCPNRYERPFCGF